LWNYYIVQPTQTDYRYGNGYKHLASGLTCGLSSLAAGFAIGIVGDAGVRANAQEGKIFVGMILILIFGEALGLYGMIVAIILSQWRANAHTVQREVDGDVQ